MCGYAAGVETTVFGRHRDWSWEFARNVLDENASDRRPALRGVLLELQSGLRMFLRREHKDFRAASKVDARGNQARMV